MTQVIGTGYPLQGRTLEDALRDAVNACFDETKEQPTVASVRPETLTAFGKSDGAPFYCLGILVIPDESLGFPGFAVLGSVTYTQATGMA